MQQNKEMFVSEKAARNLTEKQKVVSVNLKKLSSATKYTLSLKMKNGKSYTFATHRNENEPRIFSMTGVERKLQSLGLQWTNIKIEIDQ